jgi:hypothetical protein
LAGVIGLHGFIVPIVLDGFLRIAGAIVLEALALVIWNIGTRSPFHVVRDIRDALGKPRAIFAGIVAFVIGLIFVAAATVLLVPAVPNPSAYLAPAQIFTLLVALGIEFLIGNDLRRLAGAQDHGTPKI